MICWYCHWGWAPTVAEIYLRAKADIDSIPDGPEAWRVLNFGPGHIVWEDENWDCAQSCLDDFDRWWDDDWGVTAKVIVRRSLEELRDLPEDQRDVCPDDYDGEHPENYPPPPGMKMVKGL